jgi:hypothetical protein
LLWVNVFLFGWSGVFLPRPEFTRASRAAAVKHGRRPPPQAARRVLDGGEHDASLGLAGGAILCGM